MQTAASIGKTFPGLDLFRYRQKTAFQCSPMKKYPCILRKHPKFQSSSPEMLFFSTYRELVLWGSTHICNFPTILQSSKSKCFSLDFVNYYLALHQELHRHLYQACQVGCLYPWTLSCCPSDEPTSCPFLLLAWLCLLPSSFLASFSPGC